jgi:citrate/tricarballylate utilization protein
VADLLREARRQLDVCNACRYCEGYCAVFPALERRSILLDGDLAQLANLCHDCRACYQACMYAPPHEFAVDVPALLRRARLESYERFAWPRPLGRAFRHPSLAVVGTTVAGVALALAAALAGGGLIGVHAGPGAFYAVVPYVLLLVPALVATAFAGALLLAGMARFWRAGGGTAGQLLDGRLWLVAGREALTLRWLGGGAAAATTRTPSGRRRRAGRCTSPSSAASCWRSRRRSRRPCCRTCWASCRRTRCSARPSCWEPRAAWRRSPGPRASWR